MPRPNQVTNDAERGYFSCDSCDRSFNTQSGLLQHCRNAGVHRGEWCERHEWLFVSSAARAAHVANSSSHWECSACCADYHHREDLVTHMATDHRMCYDCDTYVSNYHNHRVLSHHRCGQCDQEFEDGNQLSMHNQVHLPRKLECFGCYRNFKSYSGIVIHLEAGTCSSGRKESDIDDLAWDCSRLDNGGSYIYGRADAHWGYECEKCDATFTKMSGLFQHVESKACAADYQDYDLSELIDHLLDNVPNRH